VTDSELDEMRRQYDAHTLECDFYQDSYSKVLAEKLEHKLLYEGTLHDDDIYEEIH